MPRVARIVIPGFPHHITQRGNNRQDVFFVEDDRRVYLQTLFGQALRFGLDIEGYCLMTNHVHLIATPRRPDSLAKALGRAHYLYTLYVNRLHGRNGHLWQNRFFSCALDEGHYWTAMTYVELNAVRAGLARTAWRYEWSSAAAHCQPGASVLAAGASGSADPVVVVEGALAGTAVAGGDAKESSAMPGAMSLDLRRWRELVRGRDWKEALGSVPTRQDLLDIRRCTHTGRPLGTDSWVAKLETALGRRLRPLPAGRPRKQNKKKARK